MRRLAVLISSLLCTLVVALPIAHPSPTAAQLDPAIRDRVTAAAVLIAVPVIWEEDGKESLFPVPLGSGTVVSPDGVVLTNFHVVDPISLDEQILEMQSEIAIRHPNVNLRRIGSEFVLLGSDGSSPPRPLYLAILAAEDKVRDVAALRITAYADQGRVGDPITSYTPFIVFGDSDEVALGDRVQIFAYPAIGGDSLTYTAGVISGFGFDDHTGERTWISTDAMVSGGSSGGTAINDQGKLIGIPSAGSELDCRTGDVNRDGVVDENDVGCVPVGGSLGILVPVNDAFDLLVRSGLVVLATDEQREAALSRQTPTPIPIRGGAPRNEDCSFAFDESFDDPNSVRAFDDSSRWGHVKNGALHLGVKSPGAGNFLIHDHCGTGGAESGFYIQVGHTSGWGDISILLLTEDDSEWLFSVDPESKTWSLYRRNNETRHLFYWIEPVSYADEVDAALGSLGVIVTQDSLRLLINGRTIAQSSDGILPDISGSLMFGYGVGINPYSLSGSGQTFEASIERVILSDLR